MIRIRKLLLGWLSSPGRGRSCDALHSVDRMRAILDRERTRSDRAQSNFALLTFTFPAPCEPAELTSLAAILRRRMRATDDAGLLGPRSVGVVLPETPAAGAWKLAQDVHDSLSDSMLAPECNVYVYPSNEPRDDRQSAADIGQPLTRRDARSMHVLFVQPLPAWKRAIDLVGAGMGLLLAAPLMLLIALAIKLTSRGPIFYAQQRDGLGGRKFWIYKFRSMIVDAEAMKGRLRAISEQDGPAFKLKNDPRVTPLGRFLRRTCVDELPQLFNVLKGDMSLVGPRPLPSNEARHCSGWKRRRFDVTPGLTCTWQVYGGTKVTFMEWMRMDLRYAGSRSLWHDLRLMAMTVPSIIRRDGVY